MTLAIELLAPESPSGAEQTKPTKLFIAASRYYHGANHRSRFPVAEHILEISPSGPRTTPVALAELDAVLPGITLHACRHCSAPLSAAANLPGLTSDELVRLVALVAVWVLGRAGFRPSEGTFRRPALLGQQAIGEGVFVFAHEYADEEMSERAVNFAVGAVTACISGSGREHLEGELRELLAYARRHRRIEPSTDEILCAAERRGIPWKLLKRQGRLLQLGHGSKRRLLDLTVTSNTSSNGVLIARNKHIANGLLRAALLPVPRHFVVADEEEARSRAAGIGYPLVVKPLKGNKGKGVSVGVADAEELARAFVRAQGISRQVIVEELLRGTDHRILVVNGEVVAVARRLPAHVVGDGRSTMTELVERENRSRAGSSQARLLMPLKLDAEGERTLALQHLDAESVPEQGRVVPLRTVANWSQGGVAVDATDEIHPENRDMAIRAADVIGLDIAGVDFITPDISRPYREVGGAIVEVNYRPGLLMHLSAMRDRRVDLGGPIVDGLFESGDCGRIPIIPVLEEEEEGNSGCVEMLAAILAAGGRNAGYFQGCSIRHTGDGIAVSNVDWRTAVPTLLEDPAADAAVFQIPAAAALEFGLQLSEWSAAAIVAGGDAAEAKWVLCGDILARKPGGLALPAGALQRHPGRSRSRTWFYAETMSPVVAEAIEGGAQLVVAGTDGRSVEFWRSGSLVASRDVSAWQSAGASSRITLRGMLAAMAAALAASEDIVTIFKALDRGAAVMAGATAASLVAGRNAPPESFRSMMQLTQHRRVPVQSRCEWNDSHELQIGLGVRQGRYRNAKTDRTSHLSTKIVDDKSWTNRLLRAHGLPVPMQRRAASERGALAAARRIGFPVIVKPVDSSESRGVTGNIGSEQELRDAVRKARRISRTVIIEQFVGGHDHRLIVIGGKVIHVTRHLPARVVGDGRHTIEQLVAIENRNPNRGPERHKPLELIEIDRDTERVLKGAGLSPASVPAPGQVVLLKSITNLSTGGTAIDVTQSVHPANIEVAERVVKLVDLNICGIDFLTSDIGRSCHEVGAVICEVNQRPAFDGHDVATNWNNGVRGAVFAEFCPHPASQLPVAVYRADGPSATQSAMLLRHLLVHSGHRVGFFSSGLRQAGVGLYPLPFGRSDPCEMIAAVLNDRRTEACVITAPGAVLDLRPELFLGAVVVADDESGRAAAAIGFSGSAGGASAVVADADHPAFVDTSAGDTRLYRYGLAPPAVAVPGLSCDVYWSDENGRPKLLLAAASLKGPAVVAAAEGAMRQVPPRIAAQAAAAAFALGLSPAEIRRGFLALGPDPLKLARPVEVITGLPFNLTMGVNHRDFPREPVIGQTSPAAGRRILAVAGQTHDAARLAAMAADQFDLFYCTADVPGRTLLAALLAEGVGPAAIAVAHDEAALLVAAMAAAQPGDYLVCLVGNPERCRSLARRLKAEG